MEEPQEAGMSSTEGRGETILFVEDEWMLLELLKSLFEENGYRIRTAGSGEEGLEVFARYTTEIDLVLTDMGLPKMGGWDMFQKMLTVNPKIKVILASGYVDQDLRVEMMQQGAKDFIQKPYVPATILKRIREVLDAE
jgi:DNA-binding response OmpR family regulator